MRKELIYLALLVTLFVSCEEYYKPDLEEGPGMLVVESHLTNDARQNFVKLTMTRNFYATEQAEQIIGADVYLVEEGKVTWNGIDNGNGYYTFTKTPVPGKKYMLRLIYKKETYESETVVMPPLPKIDTLYTNHKVKRFYSTDTYGVPFLVESPGREICIDAPISPQLEYYRFNWRAIIQWHYDPPPVGGYPPPTLYGWISVYNKGLFNLAGPKEFSVSDKVQNHPVLSLAYDGVQYLDSATQVPEGWIVIIDQYGITKSSYDFHEKLNKQFSAEGSLFDPVLTQVYGNISCRSDKSKTVLGFFDLNSYRQYRYYLNIGMGTNNWANQRRINRYPDIPDRGFTTNGVYPDFWETYY
jgi:hypothetical protein